MPSPEITTDTRTQAVMLMVLARLKSQGRHIGDLSPDEIKTEIEDAVADLKLAEDVVHGRA